MSFNKMRPSMTAFAVLLLTSEALANNVVTLDIQGTHPAEALRKLRKRTSPLNAYLLNDNVDQLYSVNVSVGTPGQVVQLQLDTGSTDVWVNSADSNFCMQGNCYDYYQKANSSTYKPSVTGAFNISYADGTGAAGNFITDVINIGGVTVTNQTIGVADQSDIPYGLMGVGYPGIEGSCAEGVYCYPSLLDNLVSEGKINSRAFSLFLNDLNQSTGSILFGGVDSSKYTGDLVQIPMIGVPLTNGSQDTNEYTVAWTDLTITTPNGVEHIFVENVNLPVLLDSGTSQAIFPPPIVDALYKQMGAFEHQGMGYAPCYLRVANATIDFHLGGPDGATLKIPLREFMFDIDSKLNTIWHDLGGAEYCEVGFYKGDDLPIFGDTILRSAYVVYDLDNRAVAIAPANFHPGKSNIQEIKSGSSSNIPGVARTASSVSSISAVASATAAPGFSRSSTQGGGVTSTITPVSTAPLAAFTTAKYTGQNGYSYYSVITTTSPTGTGSSSSSSGAANAVTVPKAGFAGIAVMGLVGFFAAAGAGVILL